MKTNLILAAILLFGAGSALADETVVLEQKATEFDGVATTPAGQERVLNTISSETNVPVPTLIEQRDRTGLGYGGLFIANSLASATGKTFDEIAAEKASGRGWGWIAKENNVKLGPIVSQARHAEKTLRKDNKQANKQPKRQVKTTKKARSTGHASRSPHTVHGPNGYSHRNSHVAFQSSAHGNGGAHGGGHGKGR
jgi:hypothetical protein